MWTNRTPSRRRLRERLERPRLRVLQNLEAKASRSLPANLHRGAAEHLLAVLATALEAFLVAAEEELVDLDLFLEQLAAGGNHRRPQLVQHRPGRLMATEPELALKLLGADPGMERCDQIGGPEPGPQRGARPVHHGPGGDRGLVAAGRADPQVPTGLGARIAAAATRAEEAVGPARGEQVLPARLLGAEVPLELQDRQGIVGRATPASYARRRMELTRYALSQ